MGIGGYARIGQPRRGQLHPYEDSFPDRRVCNEKETIRLQSRYRQCSGEECDGKPVVITLFPKIYNNMQHPARNEILREENINRIGFYSCESMKPLTKAAMMFHAHPPGCSTRPIVWLTNQLAYAYTGGLNQGFRPASHQVRVMMKETIERRSATITEQYDENLFKNTEPQLCEDTDWHSLTQFQRSRDPQHKQRWEILGVGAGIFFHLRKRMFGENESVHPDSIGAQEEGLARRSVYATTKLVVSSGRLAYLDELQKKGKGGKSGGRDASRAESRTERRDESTPRRERSRKGGDREESRKGESRERTGKGKTRETFQKGGPRHRTTRGEGKKGGKQPLTTEGGRGGDRGDDREETETRRADRSRSERDAGPRYTGILEGGADDVRLPEPVMSALPHGRTMCTRPGRGER